MLSLQNHTALVTGAAVRLGREISLALARKGCRLLLHCNRSREKADTLAEEIRALGMQATVLQADLSHADETEKLAKTAWERHGPVDVLINSAAAFSPTPLEKLNEAEFDKFIALNLKAPYLLSSELGRRMKAHETPHTRVIVNIACLSAFKAWKDFVPYAISKAGVVSLTQGLAKLLAPEVRVNAVAPGTVLPPESSSAESIEALRARIPLQKIGAATDVSEAVVYLCSAPFVTGQVLSVDGGRSLS